VATEWVVVDPVAPMQGAASQQSVQSAPSARLRVVPQAAPVSVPVSALLRRLPAACRRVSGLQVPTWQRQLRPEPSVLSRLAPALALRR
jgi:hypothetical protein